MKISTQLRAATLYSILALALAAMTSNAQDLIFNAPTGSTTTVTSSTNAARLFVGVDEPDNQLFVESGGRINLSLLAEVGQQSSATNSLLSVQNGGQLVIGAADVANLPASGILVGDASGVGELKVDYDSKIITDDLYLGAGSNETGKITAQNGGAIEVNGDVVVGAVDNANNLLSVKNGGELMINGAANLEINNDPAATENLNEVNIGSGGSLLVKGDVNASDLIAKDGLTFESGATLGVGGELTTVDNAINNGMNLLLDDALSTNHSARWTAASIDVGSDTANNTLSLENGAQATSTGFVYVGKDGAATDNEIAISGSNSTFTAQNKVFIGANGSRNKLKALDGAKIFVSEDMKIGSSSSASQNSVTVSGTNSALNAGSDLFVGAGGANNTMTVSDAAVVTVDGLVHVGQKGRDNKLTIDHATMTATSGLIVGAEGDSNDFIVRGTNALLTASFLTIGDQGDSNNLKLSAGGAIEVDNDLNIGANGKSNFIQLNDSNSVLRVGGDVVVGEQGDSNYIKINGGVLAAEGDVYLGTTGNASEKNSIQISGSEARVEVADQLFIGSDVSSNNFVTINNGGTLAVAAQTDIVFGAATNNTLTVSNQGVIETADWDMSFVHSNLTLGTGATLDLSGVFSGTNALDGGLNLILDGAGASWSSTGTNDLHIGRVSSDNSLTLTNGASATAANNLLIGFNDTEGNQVTLAGTGSALDVGNDLFVGVEIDRNTTALADNTLSVIEGASVSVGNNAYVYRGATLKIDSRSRIAVGGDYEQDAYSTLEIGVSSNQVQPNLTVGGTAAFESTNTNQYSIISVFSEGVGESNEIAIVRAKEITLDGNKATGGSIESNIASNSLLGFTVTLTNDLSNYYIVLSDFLERSIGEAGGLDGQLLDVANEIDFLAESGDSNAVTQLRIIEGLQPEQIEPVMDAYYGEKQSSIPANNIINLGIQNVAEQLTLRADNTRERNVGASAAPAGAAGPHEAGQELQAWFSAYGNKGKKSAADGFSAYDANQSGFMIGADMAVAQNILVGVAGGSGSASADKGAGANTDTRTTYGAIYSSIGTQTWFADASLIYGGSSVKSTFGTTFDTKADYDARNMALYLGGGKEIAGKYLILTPRASLLGNYYAQFSYEEESSSVGRKVYSFNQFYLQSTLGASMAMYTEVGSVILKPEFRAFWLHEWNAKNEDLDYRLIGGSNQYTMQMQAPEKDILKLGIGTAAKLGEYLELRADLDARLGKDYRDYTLLGSLRYQF